MKDIFFDLHLFSKYRSALMGLATIGILMCHAPANGVCLPFHLNSILGLGQMGVMVFFFVSGIGLYFSTRTMEYNSKSIIAWYRKRLVRLFVPYVILYAPYLYIIMSNSPSMNLGGVFTSSFDPFILDRPYRVLVCRYHYSTLSANPFME